MLQHKLILSSEEVVRVTTPLELITRLERENSIRTIVLGGEYATNAELERFLATFYPRVRIEHEA